MSDRFGQVLSIVSSFGRLRLSEKFQADAFDKGIETYSFSAILEMTVAGLDGKATRLMVSTHSDPILNPKVFK